MNKPQDYFVLVAPAVAFLVLLSSRQARISTIIRDNVKQILDEKTNAVQKRAENLNQQNVILLYRYHLIQYGLILLCLGLLIAGALLLYNFFGLWSGLFWTGLLWMIIGTSFTLYEIVTGADTLSYEVKFGEWHLPAIPKPAEPPTINKFVLLKRWRLWEKSSGFRSRLSEFWKWFSGFWK